MVIESDKIVLINTALRSEYNENDFEFLSPLVESIKYLIYPHCICFKTTPITLGIKLFGSFIILYLFKEKTFAYNHGGVLSHAYNIHPHIKAKVLDLGNKTDEIAALVKDNKILEAANLYITCLGTYDENRAYQKIDYWEKVKTCVCGHADTGI